MVESEDEAEACASEADEYHDVSEGPMSVEVVESDDEADKYYDASEPPTSIEPSAFISEPSGRSSTSTPGHSIDDAPIQSNPCGISIAAGDPDVVVLDGSTTRSVVLGLAATRILSKPLEVDVRLRLRSTLLDVLWWVLLGISFAIAWRRVV
ncbi:hypothetical protein B0H14DRAFT_2757799 [Mycena olivaceomarginata]|nr:hypothetical protein B0H14DRAFT_2757799 [Mycena olivaceomarginata]